MNKNTTILIIINNPELRQLYHEILITEHWEILIAEDTANGLLQLIGHPDITHIIFDIQINHLEAEKFLQLLNGKSKWKKLPIIILDYQEIGHQNQFLESLIKQFPTILHLDTHLTSPDKLIDQIKKIITLP